MHFEKSKIETSKNQVENFEKIKPETNITIKDAKDYCKNLLDKFKLSHEKFEYGGEFVGYEERLNHTPKKESDLGYFEGERGESKFIPSSLNEQGKSCADALKEKGFDGIEYKNAEPNFYKCAEATVSIENMTGERKDNFAKADYQLAERWNAENKDNRSDWKDEDVYDYRKEHKLSWHERCDTKHMDLVDSRIHDCCKHSGGVCECKTRDNLNLGGKFDE